MCDGFTDSLHLLANAVDGIRTDNGITDNPRHALVRGQLLPGDIACACTNSCSLGGRAQSPDGLLGMDDGLANGLCRCLCATTHDSQSCF